MCRENKIQPAAVFYGLFVQPEQKKSRCTCNDSHTDNRIDSFMCSIYEVPVSQHFVDLECEFIVITAVEDRTFGFINTTLCGDCYRFRLFRIIDVYAFVFKKILEDIDYLADKFFFSLLKTYYSEI